MYYNESGQITENETEAVANKTENSFFIKQASIGPFSGRLYNRTIMSELIKVYSRTRGRQALTWKKVSEQTFNLYLRYLKTDNVSYLRNAERGLD